MKKTLTTFLAAACSLWLTAGCATDDIEGIESPAGADTPDLPVTRDTAGSAAPAPAGISLGVVGSLFEGDRIRAVLDRPVDEGELVLSRTFLAATYVTDRGIEQQVISAGTELDENRQELVFALEAHDLLVEGGRYDVVGGLADGRELALGQVSVPRSEPNDDAGSNDDAQSFRLPGLPRLPLPPPRFPDIPLPPAGDPPASSFRIVSIEPNDLSRELLPRRDGARPLEFRATFSAPVACNEALLPRARDGRDPATDSRVFRVTTRMRGSWRTQLMYMDPAHPAPGAFEYRGRVRCERDTADNRTLVFEVPGTLLGNAETVVHVAGASRDGRQFASGNFYFDTELPDVFVELTRVQNLRDWSCEGVLDKYSRFRRCDVYVIAYSRALDGVGGVATINLSTDDELGDALQVGRFPVAGSFSNMNANEIINTDPTRVYEGPIGPNGLDIRLYAFDNDGNQNSANIARIIGNLTSAICAGFQGFCGGDAAEYGAKFHEAMADQVENNADDNMGQTELYLRQFNSTPAGWTNWGLDGLGPDYDHPWGARVNVGQVDVWIRVGEATPSWMLPVLI